MKFVKSTMFKYLIESSTNSEMAKWLEEFQVVMKQNVAAIAQNPSLLDRDRSEKSKHGDNVASSFTSSGRVGAQATAESGKEVSSPATAKSAADGLKARSVSEPAERLKDMDVFDSALHRFGITPGTAVDCVPYGTVYCIVLNCTIVYCVVLLRAGYDQSLTL